MVKVTVPATSANLGPGFDTLGVALDLRNTIEMSETGVGELIIEADGGGEALAKPENNLVYVAAVKAFERLGYQPNGLHIKQQVAIPVASGMGSSAASIVGGLVAANALIEAAGRKGFTPEQLLALAVEIEGHPDNVTPAMVGGFTVCCMDEARGPLHLRFDPPPTLSAVIVTPELSVTGTGKKTEKSRGVLPAEVTLKDAVYNLNRAALLVSALAQGRVDLLSVAMQDKLHQPYRASLVPGLRSVFQAALAAGAKGVALSGAGPSVLALVEQNAEPVALAMEGAFQWAGSGARSIVVGLSREGAKVIAPEQESSLTRPPYWA